MSSPTSSLVSPKRSWRTKTTSKASVKDDRYTVVRKATKAGEVWQSARELVNYLAAVKPANLKVLEELIKGQYNLANRRPGHSRFAQSLATEAEFIVSDAFLVRELGKRPSRSRGSVQSVSSRPLMCKDIRRKDNPDIQVVSFDFGKEFPALTPPSKSTPISPRGKDNSPMATQPSTSAKGKSLVKSANSVEEHSGPRLVK